MEKKYGAIVKLKTKINGHKATIAEDYQDLKEIVMDKRREEVLQKWILNKQKHTYVRINETGRSVTSSIRVGSRMTDITLL